MDDQQSSQLEMVAEIVSAYVSNNKVEAGELSALIQSVHASFAGLGQPVEVEEAVEKPSPAQIKKSIRPDSLVSFIDGKPYKTLKRHLTTNGMSFAQYRERFGLPRDYPTTAPEYSARRSEMARSLGLGRKVTKGSSSEAAAPAASTAPGKNLSRGRASPKKKGEPAAE